MAGIPYFRNGYRSLLQVGGELFCKRSFVSDIPKLCSQTTLAVYTHATGQAREQALEVVGHYLAQLLEAAPRLRTALAG